LESKIVKIAVTGPESTGKSELCAALAHHYQTVWVPEFARTYLPSLSRRYTADDIDHIYRKQLRIEQVLSEKANGIMFTDTEFINAAIWMEHVFGYCSQFISESITNFAYDYYLLTFPDLPWTEDPLRENPGKGEYFFDLFLGTLQKYQLPYGIVTGTGDFRIQNAVRLVDEFKISGEFKTRTKSSG
jgi:nicotinamide riboside kinase